LTPALATDLLRRQALIMIELTETGGPESIRLPVSKPFESFEHE
jgi:hypothetical protein